MLVNNALDHPSTSMEFNRWMFGWICDSKENGGKSSTFPSNWSNGRHWRMLRTCGIYHRRECSLRNILLNQIRDTAIIWHGRGRDQPKFSVSPERIASQETGPAPALPPLVAPEVSSASLHKNWSVRSSIRSMYQCEVHKILYKKMGSSIGYQNLPKHPSCKEKTWKMKSLLVLIASLSAALGAICNGKGLCMSLEVSQDDHFKMKCSFDR